MTNTSKYELTGGHLHLNFDATASYLNSILGIAERVNEKRKFLFASKVLGRYFPIKPEQFFNVSYQLSSLALPHIQGSCLTLGIDEAAITLGASIHEHLIENSIDSYHISTTRYPNGEPIICHFKEPHSHGADHYLLTPENGSDVLNKDTLVLVDDEISTGTTLFNLIKALLSAGLTVRKIVIITLTDWSSDRTTQLCANDAQTAHLKVKNISLVSGSWSWNPVVLEHPAQPEADSQKGTIAPILTPKTNNYCRDGYRVHPFKPPAFNSLLGDKVLVIATGEFAWQPLLFAKSLIKKGHDVEFITATISPINPNSAIKTKIEFRSLYDPSSTMYLYNLELNKYSNMLICTEQTTDLVDVHLIQFLRSAGNIVEVINFE